MKIEQYIIDNKIKLTLVDNGYTIEIDGQKYEGFISDFEGDRDAMIEGALEETAIEAANLYGESDPDFEYHDGVILPMLHQLETRLLG